MLLGRSESAPSPLTQFKCVAELKTPFLFFFLLTFSTFSSNRRRGSLGLTVRVRPDDDVTATNTSSGIRWRFFRRRSIDEGSPGPRSPTPPASDESLQASSSPSPSHLFASSLPSLSSSHSSLSARTAPPNDDVIQSRIDELAVICSFAERGELEVALKRVRKISFFGRNSRS